MGSFAEYAELGSLYDYLRHHNMDFRQILLWAKQIALGKLQYRIVLYAGHMGYVKVVVAINV